MFAGEANVTRSLRNSSFPGICCDINMGGRAMNLLTPSGMAFLCCNYETLQDCFQCLDFCYKSRHANVFSCFSTSCSSLAKVGNCCCAPVATGFVGHFSPSMLFYGILDSFPV